jgi:AcrR family transcriptional regulator
LRGSRRPPRTLCFGAWRSPVAHLLWEQGVAGSNPAAPIHDHIAPLSRGGAVRCSSDPQARGRDVARSRFDSLDPERREGILSAAALEFAGRGYAGASLGRIVEAAGISKGSLYYYFNDKEDLFVTAVETALMRLLDSVGGVSVEALTPDTYWDRLLEVGLRSAEVRGGDTWYGKLVLAFPRLRDEPEAAAAVRPALEWARRLTRDVLERGQALGVVRRDVPLGMLVELVLALEEAADRWFAEHHQEYEGIRFQRLLEARVDLMRDMLDAAHEGWER